MLVRILVIEDSASLQEFICEGLRRLGYAVDSATDGDEGLWFAQSNSYEVIVLDLMLPGMNGIKILERLRAESNNVHVLVLTARGTLEQRVEGLNAGADDYLVKPFEFPELVARIRALNRRKQLRKNPIIPIRNNVMLDTNGRLLICDGKPLDPPLTSKEYALLELLTYRIGEVVSRTEIEQCIYDDRAEPMSNVVDVAVCTLRRKLSNAGTEPLIQTRRGMGYILTAPTIETTPAT